MTGACGSTKDRDGAAGAGVGVAVEAPAPATATRRRRSRLAGGDDSSGGLWGGIPGRGSTSSGGGGDCPSAEAR